MLEPDIVRSRWADYKDSPLRFTLSLVDPVTGEAETISERSCWYQTASLSADSRMLAWVDCGPRSERQRTVHLRDLSTGEDRVLARLSRYVGDLQISPGGQRVVARACEGPSDCETLVLDAAGNISSLGSGWRPLSWMGERSMLLAEIRPREYMRRLALGEATGEPRFIFP